MYLQEVMSEWVSEYVSEWVSDEYASEWVSVCVCPLVKHVTADTLQSVITVAKQFT